MKKIFIKIILAFFTYLIGQNLQAAVVLKGGLSHTYDLQAGRAIQGSLELRNVGQSQEEIKIYQEEIQIDENGKAESLPNMNGHPRSNKQWIELSTDRVVLNPGATQIVSYRLTVPNKTNLNGSYWSSLVIEPVSANSAESQRIQTEINKPQITIQQRTRYAVQVISNIEEGQANLNFSTPKITKLPSGKYLRFDIKNTGNKFSRPKVWLDVFGQDGQNLGRIEAQTHGLFAGEKDSFQANLSKLPPGQYKGLLAAEDNTSGQVFGSDINLNIQP